MYQLLLYVSCFFFTFYLNFQFVRALYYVLLCYVLCVVLFHPFHLYPRFSFRLLLQPSVPSLCMFFCYLLLVVLVYYKSGKRFYDDREPILKWFQPELASNIFRIIELYDTIRDSLPFKLLEENQNLQCLFG